MPRTEPILIKGKIGEGETEGIEELAEALDRLGLGKKYGLVTGGSGKFSKSFGSHLRRRLNKYNYELTPPQTVEKVTSSTITALEAIAEDIHAFFATGGGTPIDAAKAAAHNTGKPLIAGPTILSHDAINSGRCTIKDPEKPPYSLPKSPPRAFIGFLDILYKSPWEYTCAGIWDTIAKYISCKEWELGKTRRVEGLSPYTRDPLFDEIPWKICLDCAKEAVEDLNRMEKVTEEEKIQSGPEHPLYKEIIDRSLKRLLKVGDAMSLAPKESSSRCASGFEHSYAHALDQLLPDNLTLHGDKVKYGILFTLGAYEKATGEHMYDNFSSEIARRKAEYCGPMLTEKLITMPEDKTELIKGKVRDYMIQAYPIAREISRERQRYTIPDDLERFYSVTFDSRAVEEILTEVGLIQKSV